MTRLQRIAFAIASIAFILIGTLHLITHFIVLDADSVMSDLDSLGSIDIFGTPSTLSDLWLATSILMGAFSVALGLSNLAVLGAVDGPPPRTVCYVNIAMLVVIVTMGMLYLGPIQMLGGPLGIAMFGFAAYRS